MRTQSTNATSDRPLTCHRHVSPGFTERRRRCHGPYSATSLARGGRGPVLAMASGASRVDEEALARRLGEPIGRADADFVRQATGFAIGGVPPLGHATPPVVLIDRDLLAFEEIWAAAGTPNAVFRLTPSVLTAVTGGQVADIKQD